MDGKRFALCHTIELKIDREVTYDKIHSFRGTIKWFFSMFTYLCDYQYYLFPESFYQP